MWGPKYIITVILAASLTIGGCTPPEEQTQELSEIDYQNAERFLSWNKDKYLKNGSITHHWIGETDTFWFAKDGENGKEYILTDATTGISKPAFDHKKLASILSLSSETEINPNKLEVKTFSPTENDTIIGAMSGSKLWMCSLSTEACNEPPASPFKPGELPSPDGKWALFAKEHNLYLRNIAKDEVIQLTKDGEQHYSYGALAGTSTASITLKRMQVPLAPIALWSPDSTKVISHKLDDRKVKDLHLLQYAPEDGGARPKLHTYRYSMPGDEFIAKSEMFIFDVINDTQTKVQSKPLDVTYVSPLASGRVWFSPDNRKIYTAPTEKYSKNQALHVIDAETGEVTTPIIETSETYIDLAAVILDLSVKTLTNGDIIWYSERDGWGHLYLYGPDGTLKNQITKGNWQVRTIIRVDENAGHIFFTSGGNDPKRDPYLNHLYRINMDGTDLKILTPENADHNFKILLDGFLAPITPGAPSPQEVTFSPTGNYFIENYSRIDMPNKTVLRKATGEEVAILAEANISDLEVSGFIMPEPFKVLAADGKTEIFGSLYKPSNFDPNKSYPIIESIYPGPQTNGVSKTFDSLFAGDRQSLAELGFIVISIDGRGTPFRSKAFHDSSYGQLGQAGNLDDHIAGLKQLAAERPYLDLNRVGIYGHSGGGFASTRAILAYPDFYKVAVSSAGNHDQRGYLTIWGATYQGPFSEEAYENAINSKLAGNLKGKLFLSHGDMDDNVHPALTMQVADALIKANKDFDFLLIPNANHGYSGAETYFPKRRWNYFVEHLLKKAPIRDYQIKGPGQ